MWFIKIVKRYKEVDNLSLIFFKENAVQTLNTNLQPCAEFPVICHYISP